MVAGEDLGTSSEDALARFRGRNVGIVFQSFHLIPTMTALENVAVPLELAGIADAHERAARELAAVGLGERVTTIRPSCPAASSSAWRWPARWRPIRPSWSPTSRPAISTRPPAADHRPAVRRPRERGTTLVLVTHDAALAARCDRVVRLRSGRIEDAPRREAVKA